MKHWKGNIDSFICPVCDLEVSNPRNYPGCKCPRCGFQDALDIPENAKLVDLFTRAGMPIQPGQAPEKYLIIAGGRSNGKMLFGMEKQIEHLHGLVEHLSVALENVLDQRDRLIADIKGTRTVCGICKYSRVACDEEPCESCPSSPDRKGFVWRGMQKEVPNG